MEECAHMQPLFASYKFWLTDITFPCIADKGMNCVATGPDRKKGDLIPSPTSLLPLRILFQNFWWESGKESFESFPVLNSLIPLGKVLKVSFSAMWYAKVHYIDTATTFSTSSTLCCQLYPENQGKFGPSYGPSTVFTRGGGGGRAEEFCFFHFFLHFSLQQERLSRALITTS